MKIVVTVRTRNEARKLEFYRNSGRIPAMVHPLEMGGSPAKLPKWGLHATA